MYKLSFPEMIEAIEQIITSLEETDETDETAYSVIVELAYQLRDEMVMAVE